MSTSDDNIIDPFICLGPAKTLTIGDGDVCVVLGQVNQARWLLERVLAGQHVKDHHLAASVLGLSQIFEQLLSVANARDMGIELNPVLQAKIDAAQPGARPH